MRTPADVSAHYWRRRHAKGGRVQQTGEEFWDKFVMKLLARECQQIQTHCRCRHNDGCLYFLSLPKLWTRELWREVLFSLLFLSMLITSLLLWFLNLYSSFLVSTNNTIAPWSYLSLLHLYGVFETERREMSGCIFTGDSNIRLDYY